MRRFRTFSVTNPLDIVAYEVILNDPLSTITEKETTIEKDQIYDDSGKLAQVVERTLMLVHWVTEEL